MKEQNLHTFVGAAVVAVTVVLLVLWNSNSVQHSHEEGYQLTATFSKVDGLGLGSDVLLAGIPIGKVISETMDPSTHQITLGMIIDAGIELPSDSSARITSDGIFGAKYISVDIGGEFELLEDGDGFEFIRDSIIFEEVFEQILRLGEEGYKKRKEAERAANNANPAFNPFANDPALLTPPEDTSDAVDIFDEFEENEEDGT